MTPISRITISLVLALVAWSPTLMSSWRSDSVDLQSAATRFLVLFFVMRLAMRWIDWLLHRYRTDTTDETAIADAIATNSAEIGRRHDDMSA